MGSGVETEGWGSSDDQRDVYVIDIAGLPTTDDNVLTRAARVVTEKIDPQRICARIPRNDFDQIYDRIII